MQQPSISFLTAVSCHVVVVYRGSRICCGWCRCVAVAAPIATPKVTRSLRHSLISHRSSFIAHRSVIRFLSPKSLTPGLRVPPSGISASNQLLAKPASHQRTQPTTQRNPKLQLRGFSSTKCQTVVTSPSQLPRDFPRFTSPRLSSPQIPLLAEPRPDEPKWCKISRVMIGQSRGKPEG